MRIYLTKQMFVAAGAWVALALSAQAAPPQPSTSAPTVAKPGATVVASSSASNPQFFGSSTGVFSSTPIGPTHPDYWSRPYNLGNLYGAGGVLSSGYWFPVSQGSTIVAGGTQSAGAPPKGAIVAGGATAGLHFAGAAPSGAIVAGGASGGVQSAGAAPGGGVIVAGGPTGGAQSAGAAQGNVIVAGGPVGGVQSARGVIVAGGAHVSTNAPR